MNSVAICIVAFGHPEQIAACLDAVAASDMTAFEVVICENGGPAAHRTLRETLPARMPGGQPIEVILAEGNLGYAGGVNRCMAARPDARAWWVLNPDTQVEPAALGAMLSRLDRGDCDAVGCTLYHPGGSVQAHGGHWRPALARAESIGYGRALTDPVDPAAVERTMNYILGASMLVGRGFVARVGLMRDDYFLYAEEIEWCLRGIAAGLRLGFAPAARVCHGQGATTGSADSIRDRPRLPIYMDERNKLLVVRDTTPALFFVAAPASLVLTMLRFARRRAWRQWRWALSGWWAGVRGRRGPPPWLRS